MTPGLRISLLKDLVFRTTLAVWLVMMAVSHDFVQFVLRTAIFSLIGFAWSLTVPLFSRETAVGGWPQWGTWATVDLIEVLVAGLLWRYLVHHGEYLCSPLFLAAVYGSIFIVDVFLMSKDVTHPAL